MKTQVYASPYLIAFFDTETKIYSSEYLPATETMTDQQWKELMQEVVNIIEKCKPDNIIDDNRERHYAYSPDMQKWTLSLFTDSWNKIGLKKYAQITPREILGKLTTHQIEELASNEFHMNYKVKIVDDFESALSWIIE